jgi:hypothetical protein
VDLVISTENLHLLGNLVSEFDPEVPALGKLNKIIYCGVS